MASIAHKDISDPNRHEPKGASTAVNKSVYVSNGAGSGIWKRLSNSDLDYSVKANNRFGWNDISGNQYTSGSPRAITSGTRTQLTNNGLATQTDISRLGALWDTTNNQFLINDLNGFYNLRLNMKVTAAAAAGTPYILLIEAQSDSGSTVIAGTTQILKGGGYVNQINYSIGFYLGSTINNSPLKLFITPDTNINVYDIGFVIQRVYTES